MARRRMNGSATARISMAVTTRVTTPCCSSASRFDRISYLQVLEHGLKVMDATAISLCMDNHLPIVVFNLLTAGNIKRAILGEAVGSVVTA